MCDTPEQIIKCLHCTRPECVNCISNPGNGHPVEQIDPETGAVVAVYESQVEAARLCRLPRSGVSNVLHGIQKTCGGYKWRHAVRGIKDNQGL